MRKSLAPSQRNKLLSNSPLTPRNLNSSVRTTPHSSPLVGSLNSISSQPEENPAISESSHTLKKAKRVFSVVFGKPSKKKHKTWDGDGILEVFGKTAILKENGNTIGQTTNLKKSDLSDGTILFVGSKEVEISSEITSCVADTVTEPAKDEPVALKRKSSCFEDNLNSPLVKRERKSLVNSQLANLSIQRFKSGGFMMNFEPLVMPAPNDSHQWTCNPDNLPITPVSVANNLCRVLRKHQREGVTFLYNCVAGLRDLDFRGAILADEMGLGKTLQCITLVWTLLRQGPYGKPLLKKILIVVPSSLVQNWKNEFTRWIGSHLVKPFVVDKNTRPKDFHQSRSPVLIISYEMFVKSHEDVKNSRFDLVICDEGHRLKNTNIRCACLLNSIPCKARILLTGTPIQNDLQEFYALVDFVNPGILGSPSEFGRNFEKPILASKEPHSPSEVVKLGNAQAEELNRLTSDFILRRTQELIGKYLPLKTEYVVFCEPTDLQKTLYTKGVNYWTDRMEELGNREMPRHLSVIAALKKICNHPILLKNHSSEDEGLESLGMILENEGRDRFFIEDSSKMVVVDSILKNLRNSNERLILVSNFTQTLDLFAELCSSHGCKFLRFDGSTPTTQRNDIVSQFNNPNTAFKVLLLSSKAGGVGLNLIGASRLILYDSDWNPATDLQAMARIWREGQKKNVHIYRLLTSGTIEEKIFQRQLKKTGLSESIVDNSKSNSVKLSNEELRDLFTYTGYDKCLTHDALKCECPGDGTILPDIDSEATGDERDCQILTQQTTAPSGLRMNQLQQWEHHRPPLNDSLTTEMMTDNANTFINFVFRNYTS